jgi:Trypsin
MAKIGKSQRSLFEGPIAGKNEMNVRSFYSSKNHKMRLIYIFVAICSLGVMATPVDAVVKGVENLDLARYSVMVLDDHGEMCSAVILSKNVILTAAHCVAHASDWRVHWRDQDGTPILVKPEVVRVHPSYDPNAIAKRRKSVDLALIGLDDPLPEQFRPVTISNVPSLVAGDKVTVAGFGFSEEKNRKTLGKMRSVDLSVVEPYGSSPSVIWLADDASGGSGACQGDSGGPVYFQGQLFAVITWSTGNGKSNCGVYTQGMILFPQREWINKFVEDFYSKRSRQ